MLIIGKSCAKARRRAAKTPPTLGDSDLDLLAPIGRRGSFPWARPDHMEPSGVKSLAEVRELMRRQYSGCVETLKEMGRGEGSVYKVRMSVNSCGKLDLYQWLYFLAQHARRHLVQMEANRVEWEKAQDKCAQ